MIFVSYINFHLFWLTHAYIFLYMHKHKQISMCIYIFSFHKLAFTCNPSPSILVSWRQVLFKPSTPWTLSSHGLWLRGSLMLFVITSMDYIHKATIAYRLWEWKKILFQFLKRRTHLPSLSFHTRKQAHHMTTASHLQNNNKNKKERGRSYCCRSNSEEKQHKNRDKHG